MGKIHYFRSKHEETAHAAISGEEALHNYQTDDRWEEISREEFEREVYANGMLPVDVNQLAEAAGVPGFALNVINLDEDDKIAFEQGIFDICPACGETDCGQTCYAYLEPDWDGDECLHCHSTHTMRIDTILGDPVVWTCECYTCGKSFEVITPPEAQS